MAEEEIEYVSDPEEAKLSLKMRRREASDDEEEDEEQEEEESKRPPSRHLDGSDGESEGGAADYEEDELDEEEEEYELEDEEYVEEEEVDYEESRARKDVEVVVVERRAAEEEEGKDGDGGAGELGEEEEEKDRVSNVVQSGEAGDVDDDEGNVDGEKNDEEKKDVEPYAVPTAGAFYMHDDRFRDNAGGRHRRMLGGRKLWESKDDRKWGHDKFEELSSKERHNDERRRGSRGRGRGRGRSKGGDRVYAQGNRPREPREVINNGAQNYNNNNNNNNQNNVLRGAPKGARGRGPRRYQPSFKNDNDAPLMQNKQSGKSGEKHSRDNSLRDNEPMSNAESEKPRKQVSSNLSVASPPFYPSSSSAKDSNVSNKRDVQAGTVSRNGSSAVDGSFTGQPTGVRGKNKVGSVGMNNLYIDDSLSAMAPKSAHTSQMPGYGQGRGITSLPQMSYQSAVPNNQANRGRPHNQLQAAQRNSGQSRGQFSAQASAQQSTRGLSGTQVSSPPRSTGAVKNVESGELESHSDSGKTKTALVPKGKGTVQGSGRGSFIYGGPQVIGASGNMDGGRGDQNFPTFLPVMQFGAQPPGGMGVPAVGMAFPGYVGGRGSSEMTWLPVLAGPAGPLGAANFFNQHLAVDGSYHARPSGQATSITATSSKENNATKVGKDWNPTQRPELATDDSGQRQKNPRRYTEMKFDH